MNERERDALLIRLDERTQLMATRGKLIEDTLFGTPGSSGLISTIAVLKDDMRQREAEALELRRAVPDVKNAAKTSARWNSGIIAAVVAIIAGVIQQVLAGNPPVKP